MVSNCNINAFSNLSSIIYVYNENMNFEMTIKKVRAGVTTNNDPRRIMTGGSLFYVEK